MSVEPSEITAIVGLITAIRMGVILWSALTAIVLVGMHFEEARLWRQAADRLSGGRAAQRNDHNASRDSE